MRLFMMLTALLMGVCADAHASAADCGPMPVPPPKVNMRYTWNVKVDLTRSEADLTKVKTEHTVPGYDRTMGLTLARRESTVELIIGTMKSPSGGLCVQPREVKITLGYPQVVVYVAKRFPKGSCPFQTVLLHEQQHVEASKQALAKYGPHIEEAVMEAINRQSWPVAVRSEAEARRILMGYVNAAMKPALDAMDAEEEGINKALDTAENYKATLEQCASHEWAVGLK